MPTQPRITLEPGEELAGYRIESYIARGGMAVVYLARDLSLGRRVALKLLAPELTAHTTFRARFIRESELAASVDHPNILPIYQAGEADNVLYIAMRYVDGEDLAALLQSRANTPEGHGQLTLSEAMPLFTQVAGALDAAHNVGLVHRDVKPGNILLSDTTLPVSQRHAYLTDFGLTKRSTSLTGLTTTGHFLGTLAYVAPEQIAGRPLDGRTDIYSLGCVMFQTLAGQVPFPRDDDAATLWAHMSEPRPKVSDHRDDLPPTVDVVLNRAMALDPAERQQSCRAVVEELRRAFRAAPAPAPAAGARVRAARGQPVSTASPAPSPPSVPPPQRQALQRPEPAPKAVARKRRPRQPAELHAPRARTRRRILGLLAALALVVAGVLTAVFTLQPDNSWADTGTQAAPFRLEHPPNWQFHPATDAVMYAATPSHLIGLFTDGDKEAWQRAGKIVNDDPANLTGIMLRHTGETQKLNTSAEAADVIRASPAFRHDPLGKPVPARVDGVNGWRLNGTLTNPNSGGTPDKIAYSYYVLNIPSGTAHLVFFALPDRMAAQDDTFTRVRATIQLPKE
nr:serine/threonine protein kinase [Streptomyces sp. S1D4-11]